MLFLNNGVLPSNESHQASATYHVDESQKKKTLKNNQPKCVAREARFKLMHMYNFI